MIDDFELELETIAGAFPQIGGDALLILLRKSGTWHNPDAHQLFRFLNHLRLVDVGHFLENEIKPAEKPSIRRDDNILHAPGDAFDKFSAPTTKTRTAFGNGTVTRAITNQRHGEIIESGTDNFT